MLLLVATCLPLTGLISCSDSQETSAPVPGAPPDAETPQPASIPEHEPEGAVLEGHASVELRIEKTQILGRIELVLVPEEASEKILTVRNQQWLIKASRFKFNDGYNNLDLKMIGGTAVEEAVARTRADAEGNYRFTGLTPGKYRLYGQYKSRYAAGFWLIPVEITSPDDEITLDLNHENMHEIQNREIIY